jgi:hypothetical protein
MASPNKFLRAAPKKMWKPSLCIKPQKYYWNEDAMEEAIKEVRENEMAAFECLVHLRSCEVRCLDWRRENYLHKYLTKVNSVRTLSSAAKITKLTFRASVF